MATVTTAWWRGAERQSTPSPGRARARLDSQIAGPLERALLRVADYDAGKTKASHWDEVAARLQRAL